MSFRNVKNKNNNKTKRKKYAIDLQNNTFKSVLLNASSTLLRIVNFRVCTGD